MKRLLTQLMIGCCLLSQAANAQDYDNGTGVCPDATGSGQLALASDQHDQFAFTLLKKDPEFKKRYLKLAKGQGWFERIDGPSHDNRWFIPGKPAKDGEPNNRVLLLQHCKPHDCADKNIFIAYEGISGQKTIGFYLYEDGKTKVMGYISSNGMAAIKCAIYFEDKRLNRR